MKIRMDNAQLTVDFGMPNAQNGSALIEDASAIIVRINASILERKLTGHAVLMIISSLNAFILSIGHEMNIKYQYFP